MHRSENVEGRAYITARKYLSRTSFLLLSAALVISMVVFFIWFPDGSHLHHTPSRIRSQQRRRAQSLQKISQEIRQRLDLAVDCLAQKCGDMEIPYPFGLSGCARNKFFELNCTYTEGVNSTGGYQLGSWPFLSNVVSGNVQGSYQNVSSGDSILYDTNISSFQVLNITSGKIVIETTRIKATYCWLNDTAYGNATILLPSEGPYRISSENILIAVGCGSTVQYSSNSAFSDDYGGACGPNSCNNQFYYDFCNLYDCCTMSIQPALNIYLQGGGIAFAEFSTCGYGALLSTPSYRTLNSGYFGNGTYGTELDWAIRVNEASYPALCSSGNDSVTTSPYYACSPTPAICNNFTFSSADENDTMAGYFCTCEPGYHGDGYRNGSSCEDIDECADSSLNKCVKGACINYDGNYTCHCPRGNHGDGFENGTGCTGSNTSKTLIIGLSTVSGTLVLVTVSCCLIGWLYRIRQQEHHARDQSLSRMEVLREMQSTGGAHICKIFSFEELKRATSNFAEHNVVGIGGFGKIYRGTLDDGLEVAIKKAKRDVGGGRNDTKQFINEVTILSSVNHNNLVKLLGCCLETPAPILVYEFVSKGSLQNHIRRSKRTSYEDETMEELVLEETPKSLDWNQRLKIAIGTAAALAYLHSGTSPPIYHRDVKSANILLDKKYVAKVADFGLSKFVPIDNERTHLSTAVQGTPGYLFYSKLIMRSKILIIKNGIFCQDPEYFENYQITEKSDVYSFGVVLLELLTGEQALDFSRPVSDQNLVSRCRRLWRFSLFEEIIDPTLDKYSNPGILDDIHAVARVAIECVQKQGQDRPTMKQVEDQLRMLGALTNLVPSSSQSSEVNYSGTTEFMTSDDDAADVWDSMPFASRVITNSEDPIHSINLASRSADSMPRSSKNSQELELARIRKTKGFNSKNSLGRNSEKEKS